MTKNIIMKQKYLFWLFAIIAALSFDQLFWEKPFGINFFIFVIMAVLGGLLPMWIGKISIPWTSYVLLVPMVLFAAFTFIRSEPLTTLMNVLLTFGFLILFTIALRNGAWFKYEFRDHIINFLTFLLHGLIGGVLFFVKIKSGQKESNKSIKTSNELQTSQNSGKRTKRNAYLRGLLLALPIVLIFAALLAAADPVFGSKIFGIFDWFEFDQLGEYLFRLFYVFIIAYLLLGAYFFGLVKSADLHKETREGFHETTFLGTIEAGMILGAVNLLFLSFVFVQLKYFFGGDQNVTIEGFTYAEYARRGFFELLAVTIISGILFYSLSRITERKAKTQKQIFTGLSLVLVALVAIILVSAYTRLTLYEDAYGFTRLRTFTHVFMIWTGVILVSLGALEISQKMKHLPVVLIFSLMLFGLTINILNVDGFIVQQNIERGITRHNGESDESLDSAYLSELSFDSIPPLTSYYLDTQVPEDLRLEIGGVLACRQETFDLPDRVPWTSWHYARSKAISQLQNLQEKLSDYRVFHSDNPWGLFAEINQETFPCSSTWD